MVAHALRTPSKTVKLRKKSYRFYGMSFLEHIQARRVGLRPTITKVTYTDGTQKQFSVNDGSVNELALDSTSYGFVVDTKPDTFPACILDDFLYLGSQDAVSLQNIQQFHITDILSIGIPLPESSIMSEDGRRLTISSTFVECLDLPETQLKRVIDQSVGIINAVRAKNGRILVHCNAGVSRSASICIAYLMQSHRMTFDDAYALVKSKRECIQPNHGFLKQLKELQISH